MLARSSGMGQAAASSLLQAAMAAAQQKQLSIHQAACNLLGGKLSGSSSPAWVVWMQIKHLHG